MVGVAELGRALRRPASVYLPNLNRTTCSADSGVMSFSQAGSKNICDAYPTHGRNSLVLRHVVVNSVWDGMSCHSARSPLSAMPTHACAGDLRYLCYGENGCLRIDHADSVRSDFRASMRSMALVRTHSCVQLEP